MTIAAGKIKSRVFASGVSAKGITMGKKRYWVIFLLLTGVGAGVFYFRRPDYQGWLLAAEKPLLTQLEDAAKFYLQGEYRRAEAGFVEALKTAQANDVAANEKWRELPINSRRRVLPARIFADNEKTQKRDGIDYFKPRISEAAYGLALARFGELQTRYRLNLADADGFSPPPEELKPALDALATGLAISPQSESLRLLKAEIFAKCRRYGEALATLDEVLLISAKSAEAYNLRALIYSSPAYLVDRDNWEINSKKALADWEKATEFSSLNGTKLPDPFFNLGMYYATPPEGLPLRADDADRAREYLTAYLKIVGNLDGDASPNAEIAAAALAKLPKN
ncbi:MAG: hypothetical protein LBP75_06225 [Planctomycetota bacterium]|nr:hypothetical protein [Planctomycetota bacterium]